MGPIRNSDAGIPYYKILTFFVRRAFPVETSTRYTPASGLCLRRMLTALQQPTVPGDQPSSPPLHPKAEWSVRVKVYLTDVIETQQLQFNPLLSASSKNMSISFSGNPLMRVTIAMRPFAHHPRRQEGAIPARFEPATHSLEGCCSIH